jgi:hypothetical protein
MGDLRVGKNNQGRYLRIPWVFRAFRAGESCIEK